MYFNNEIIDRWLYEELMSIDSNIVSKRWKYINLNNLNNALTIFCWEKMSEM